MSAEQGHYTPAQAPSIYESLRQELLKPSPLKHPLGNYALLRSHDGFAVMEDIARLEGALSPHETLKTELEARIADQPAAIEAIVEAIDRSRMRLEGDERPVATLAFLGPTGVGKSETAKVLADILGEDKFPNLIKIDCSNYSHGHEVAALTGAPPGYIGHERVPLLASARVERPGTVILFDEIEKGSDALYNLMLQITGDGELVTSDGNTTDFSQAVVILTSNLGAREMGKRLDETPLGFTNGRSNPAPEDLEQTATKAFVEHFRPEFINRLDKLVVFHPLSQDGLERVLDKKLSALNKDYENQYGLRLTLSDTVRQHLVAEAAAEPAMGARPLMRALQTNIQSTLGRYYSNGYLPEGTHVRVAHCSEIDNLDAQDDREFIFTARTDESLHRRQAVLDAPIEDWAETAVPAVGKELIPTFASPTEIKDEDE